MEGQEEEEQEEEQEEGQEEELPGEQKQLKVQVDG